MRVDPLRRKIVIDAALDLAEEINTVRIKLLRTVVRTAGAANTDRTLVGT